MLIALDLSGVTMQNFVFTFSILQTADEVLNSSCGLIFKNKMSRAESRLAQAAIRMTSLSRDIYFHTTSRNHTKL